MKKLFVILMLCLSQSGCLAVAVVDTVSGEDEEDAGDLE